jgi:RNA polymerase sigma factor (sigma-70 family)
MTEEEIIHGCLKYNRNSQRMLYELYFEEMMNLCIRYAKNHQEAKQILLIGFKNLFKNFTNFEKANSKREKDSNPISIQEWIKKEMIASAIQCMHNNKQQHFISSTINARGADKNPLAEITDEQIIKSTTQDIIIKALQQLTPSYRTIYNLHLAEGFSHLEISKLLDISEYTSSDSFAKAKYNLRKNIVQLITK